MNAWIRWTFLLILGSAASTGSAQSFQFLKINPRATYLRDSQWAPAATTLDIAAELALNPLPYGQDPNRLRLEVRTVGWFDRAPNNPASHNVSNEAVAVFSTGGALDPDWSKQFRVGSPIDEGDDFYTLPTWVGNLATDIPEDFRIGATWMTVDVPSTATHVLFTPYDNDFWNNSDDFSMPGADPRGFGLEWRLSGYSSVPEPSTILGLSLSALGLWKARSRRSNRTRP